MRDIKRKNKINIYEDRRIIPVIGTVRTGKFAGVQFSLFGSAEVPDGFCQSGISLAASGKVHSHHGCTFQYAKHEDAIPLHGKLTQEIIDYLNEHRSYLRPIWAMPVKGKYKGARYPFCRVEDVNKFFTSSGVRGVINGFVPTHKSFNFMYIQNSELKYVGDYPTLTQEIVDETRNTLNFPFIATINSGELEGSRFGVVHKDFSDKYLQARYVRTVLSDKRESYKGCTFEIVPYEKAIKLVDAVTPEILHYLEKKSRNRKG